MEPVVYALLIVTSVVSLTFIVERALALRWRRVVPPEIEAADHLHWPIAENVDAIQTRARHEITRLERGLVVLEIIVGIAPLLGLVGTIAGMMTLLGNIGQSGLPEASGLAKGIAPILNATLMGLLIAIPSLIFWSYYSKKVETIAVERETLCDEFIRRQYREEAKKT